MKDKKTLYTIIVLLVIFLPLGLYGTIKHLKEGNVLIDDNPNKEYVLNNKVYFYDDLGNLVNTYECQKTCSKITPTIIDGGYNINYYEGHEEVLTDLKNNYAFFKEGDKTILYSIVLGKKFLEFDSIKTYNVKHSNPIAILQSNNLYGVFSISNMQVLVPYEYDFISIPNRVKDGVLDTSRFIVLKNNDWSVIEDNEVLNKSPFKSPIVDFNDNYIVTSDGGTYYNIYDYNNNTYLESLSKKKVYCIGNYVVIISNIEANDQVLIYDNLENEAIYNLDLPDYTEIRFEDNNENIDLYLDNNLYQSIVLK